MHKSAVIIALFFACLTFSQEDTGQQKAVVKPEKRPDIAASINFILPGFGELYVGNYPGPKESAGDYFLGRLLAELMIGSCLDAIAYMVLFVVVDDGGLSSDYLFVSCVSVIHMGCAQMAYQNAMKYNERLEKYGIAVIKNISICRKDDRLFLKYHVNF